MTIKNFFNIILKIFGLFFLRDFFQLLIQFGSTLFIVNGKGNTEISSIEFSIVLLQMMFVGLLVYILLYKTSFISNILKLEKGFSEEMFSFHFSISAILQISLIVIGGIILIDEIPGTCAQLYILITETFVPPNLYQGLIISIAKILIAMLLIGERKRIADFMEKKGIE